MSESCTCQIIDTTMGATGYTSREFGRADPLCPIHGCTCELREVSTIAEHECGDFQYVRGDPRGCAAHETDADRERRRAASVDWHARQEKRWEAQRRARMAP